MSGAVVEISSKSFRQSSLSLSTKNAWAQIARRMFYGQNLIKAAMRRWDLTEGQARGLVYASITQPTIDHILKRNPIEGFTLSLEVTAIVTGIRLEEYIEYKAEETRHGIAEFEAEERRWADMSARLGERRTYSRRGAR